MNRPPRTGSGATHLSGSPSPVTGIGPDLSAAAEHLIRDQPDSARELLHRAADRHPHEVNLRIALAQAEIFAGRPQSALTIYRDLLQQHPQRTDIRIRQAVFTAATGHRKDADTLWGLIVADQPELGQLRDDLARCTVWAARLVLTDEIPRLADVPAHAVVVLGHRLTPGNQLSPVLRARLALALRAAQANPSAQLILSGGIMRGRRRSEAAAMSEWLQHRGVSTDRLLLEDRSRSTVENAIYSLDLAAAHRIDALTVLTSADHARRGAALFHSDNAARRRTGRPTVQLLPPITVPPIPSNTITTGEILAIHRDILRVNGFWAVPGFLR